MSKEFLDKVLKLCEMVDIICDYTECMGMATGYKVKENKPNLLALYRLKKEIKCEINVLKKL